MKLQMFSALLAGRHRMLSRIVPEGVETLQEHLDQPAVTRSTTAGVRLFPNQLCELLMFRSADESSLFVFVDLQRLRPLSEPSPSHTGCVSHRFQHQTEQNMCFFFFCCC